MLPTRKQKQKFWRSKRKTVKNPFQDGNEYGDWSNERALKKRGNELKNRVTILDGRPTIAERNNGLNNKKRSVTESQSKQLISNKDTNTIRE